MGKQTDGSLDRWVGGWINGWMYKRIEEWMGGFGVAGSMGE